MNYDITTGTQTVTGTGPATGTLDTSAMSGDYTLSLLVAGLTAGTATIAIEDTASSTAFSDAQQQAVFTVTGPVETVAPITLSVRRYQVGLGESGLEADTASGSTTARFGATNTKLRANVITLTGSSPSLSLHAQLEQ